MDHIHTFANEFQTIYVNYYMAIILYSPYRVFIKLNNLLLMNYYDEYINE